LIGVGVGLILPQQMFASSVVVGFLFFLNPTFFVEVISKIQAHNLK
jgi:hypothetical protein